MVADRRGAIRNRSFANQVKDFSGLRFGNITPTDIDGLLDFHGRAWVKMEFKHGDSQLPHGQRLALERLCDDCERSGKPSLLLIARHDTTGDIDCAGAHVVEFRWRYKWHRPTAVTTVRQAVERFYQRHVRAAA